MLQVALAGQGGRGRPLVTGWLGEATQRVWERPADVSVAAGPMLGADDLAGVVYRIHYQGPGP